MAVRNLDDEFWVRQVANAIGRSIAEGSGDTVHVITDVRFSNEWDILNELRYEHPHLESYLVYIDRDFKSDGHASEDLEWRHDVGEHRQYELVNVGTLDDLKVSVATMLNQLAKIYD